MIPDWFPVVITIGVMVMAVAMLVQLGTMIGLYLSVRGITQKVEKLIHVQIEPILNSAQSIVNSAQSIVQDTRRQVDRLYESLESTTRSQMAKVDQVVTEATDRARLQVIRADELMSDTLNRVERSVDYIERSVVTPVREVQAVARGIGSAVEHLRRRRSRNSPERVTQDEEMFI